MNLVLTNLKITLLATVSVSKITSFLIRQRDWKDILNYVNEADKEQRIDNNPDKKEIISKYTRYCRRITYYYWLLMYTTVAIVIGQPIYKYLTSEIYRHNVRNGTEKYDQVSYASIYGGGWITSFDTNAIVTMVFVKSEIEMQRIDNSLIFGTEREPSNGKEAKTRIIKCYEHHLKLIKYFRLFDSCLSPIMLLYVIVCSVMLCATTVQLTTESSAMQKLITFQYLMFGVSQVFIYCWHSNDVFYASQDLILGPYESLWLTRTSAEQKNLHLLAGQLNKQIVFTAGPFSSINLATFINILKGAYSYYTLLN